MKLCPRAPDDGGRCDDCPVLKLNEACESYFGHLMRRAADIRNALNLGVQVGLDEIMADEFYAMLVIETEQQKYDKEKQG